VNTTLDEIAEYIQLGKIKVVSDGSYIEQHKAGTSASIIVIDEHKYSIVRHMTSGEALVQGSP
jgi:predicted amino acid racemase